MTKIVFKDYKNIKQVVRFLFEDDNLVVVDKPARLPVIPDRSGSYSYNLRDMVRKHLQKQNPGTELLIVHRIDTDTTGIVLLCKNEFYHKKLNELFEKRSIEKKYLALVTGHMPDKNGLINKPLLKTDRRMIIHEKGKPSQTEYRVLEEFDNYSLLQLKPLSGRTHQIRVHLMAMGCPLVVDPLYGKNEMFYLHQIKRNFQNKKEHHPGPLCSRLTLHAAQLSFQDPQNGRQLSFEAGPPKDFMAVLKSLRKYNSTGIRQNKAVLDPGQYL